MADTAAKRCPVFATLRKAVVVNEEIFLNGLIEGKAFAGRKQLLLCIVEVRMLGEGLTAQRLDYAH